MLFVCGQLLLLLLSALLLLLLLLLPAGVWLAHGTWPRTRTLRLLPPLLPAGDLLALIPILAAAAAVCRRLIRPRTRTLLRWAWMWTGTSATCFEWRAATGHGKPYEVTGHGKPYEVTGHGKPYEVTSTHRFMDGLSSGMKLCCWCECGLD
jgi:hypothetical protein